jgi:3-isopropylmalate dehydratase small subunit
MTPLVTVTGPALSLPERDVDTDIIYPARFLLITERDGLGAYAFHDRRGTPGFSLAPGETSAPPILIAGANFGCGSSREQAPWALAGLGIRVVIAESFGEIFYSNCTKNGMLPIRLDAATVARLDAAARAGATFHVDLEHCIITLAGEAIRFVIDPGAREALLNGWSEVARIAALHGADIARFETAQAKTSAWLWPAAAEEQP